MNELRLFEDWTPNIFSHRDSSIWISWIDKEYKRVTLKIVGKDDQRYYLVLPANRVVVSFVSHDSQYNVYIIEGAVDLQMFFEIHGEIKSNGEYWIRLVKRI